MTDDTAACGDKRGTTTGHSRHRRAGEAPCCECREAHNAFNRQYRRERKPPTQRRCARCGSHFTSGHQAARYCTRKCKERDREGTPDRKVVADRSKLKRALRWLAMQPHDRPIGPTLADIGPLQGPVEPSAAEVKAAVLCGVCGSPTGGPKWCDSLCESIGIGRRLPYTAIKLGQCAVCGSTFARPAHTDPDTCSSACTDRRLRRQSKRRRRAAKRGSHSESYTPREIAERDNWRCHLCGGVVPDREYRARPDDPTIDHLIPVSAGGSDTRVNVALAHNQCNWERGVGGEVQLRLVG